MFEAQSQVRLRQELTASIEADRGLLDQLRAEIRPLRASARRILPRSTTSLSLVGTDGGNNQLQFDPFLVQIVRIVDSSNNEYCLEAVTPSTATSALSSRQFNPSGKPRTALGEMMEYLGVRDLGDLSPMIPAETRTRPRSPRWVEVYRDLMEWAVLFSVIRNKDFGTDTVIVRDGFLRSKVFSGDLFKRLVGGINESIAAQYLKNRRRVYLAGVAKRSQVLTRYRLAMALEQVLMTDYPAYVVIPREIEAKSSIHREFDWGDDWQTGESESSKFVGGKMFFVKFGNRPRDPVWPVDIFLPQEDDSQLIIGCMLSDAIAGFPVPFYPQCLQRAHENAALVDFDFDILQDEIYEGVRSLLGDQGAALDIFRLQDLDVSSRRYD